MRKKEIYISPNGDDKNGDGTASSPFASISRGVEAAGNGTVLLKEGTYFLQEPLELGRENSGLTLRACHGEAVTLTGAMPIIAPNWKQSKENARIYETMLEPGLKMDGFYVGSQPQTLARFPNREPGRVPLEGAATRAQIRERAKGYRNPRGGYLRAIHEAGWGGNSYIIEAKDDTNPLGLSYHWVGDNNRGSGMRDEVVIENVLEELDAPGEWYYDNETGRLSFYPEEETQLTLPMSAAVNTELIRMVGESPERPLTGITVKDIAFFATKRTLFTIHEPGKAYVPLLRGDWCVVRAGAVYMENAKEVTLDGCSFLEMGGNALFLSGYGQGNTVRNCEFQNIGASAIQIVGFPSAVWEPSFWPHALYPELPVHKTTVEHADKRGPKTEEYPRDILIESNHIENVGVVEKQSSGVNLSVSSRVRILHNTIHKSARSNINVNDGTFGGHEIAYNDCFDAQRETEDHGPFNSWGRDRFWSVPRYNASGHHGELLRQYPVPSGAEDLTELDAVETTAIHNNRFHHRHGAPHSWGIDLDDGSTNYEIYENLCLGLGIKLREGFHRRVYNNILVDGELQIHVPYAGARDDVYHNLILSRSPVCFAAVTEKRFRATQTKLYENWYFCPDASVKVPGWFAAHKGKSLVDTGTLLDENPRFRDAAQNDYTVLNSDAAERIGFHNFPMDTFGKPGCPAKSPAYKPMGGRAQGEEGGEAWLGAVICNLNEALMSSTACAGRNGVYFSKVPKWSPAYRMGFRQRDVVKFWAKRPVKNVADFKEKIALAVSGAKAEIEVHRSNMPCTIYCRIGVLTKLMQKL